MAITTHKKTCALIASTLLTTLLALSPTLAMADVDLCVSAELPSGYIQRANVTYSGATKVNHEANCSADHKAKKEGSCGKAKCGADNKAKQEGSCDKAKCGAHKNTI